MSSDKTTERFAQLFQRIEKTSVYRVEGLKVEIAEQIYLAMQRSGINNADLARRLGKSRPYVTKVLSGNVNFTLETLVSIGDALNCEISLGLKPKASSSRWSTLPAHQAKRVSNWREQNYIRPVPDRPAQPREEEGYESLAAAA